VDDQEQLVERLRDQERGRCGDQLIAPLAGEDRPDQRGGDEVGEVARRAAQDRELELG
jgi:hypothetical protein